MNKRIYIKRIITAVILLLSIASYVTPFISNSVTDKSVYSLLNYRTDFFVLLMLVNFFFPVAFFLITSAEKKTNSFNYWYAIFGVLSTLITAYTVIWTFGVASLGKQQSSFTIGVYILAAYYSISLITAIWSILIATPLVKYRPINWIFIKIDDFGNA